MPTFHDPPPPSPLATREGVRPRFDGNLESLRNWLDDLKAAGVRQAAPELMLALNSLRRAELSPNRRLAVLAALKTPLLKTCAGLPKPNCADDGRPPSGSGVTLEQRLYRLMFVNLHQSLHQLDQMITALPPPLHNKREWVIRNLYRFANRQIRYAARWSTSLPAQTWSDLHQLHLELMNAGMTHSSLFGAPDSSVLWMDPDLEYKQLLLFGMAARLNPAIIQRDDFLDSIESWAAQTLLTDPQQMLDRPNLFTVEIGVDGPPRQQSSTLSRAFRGWIVQAPYPFLHQLED